MMIAKTCCCTLVVALCAAAWATTRQKAGVDTNQPPNGSHAGRTWIDIGGKDVEGRGWNDTELPFDRIPKRFAKDLPQVWGNGLSSTGEFFEFESDTTSVAVRTEFAGRCFGGTCRLRKLFARP